MSMQRRLLREQQARLKLTEQQLIETQKRLELTEQQLKKDREGSRHTELELGGTQKNLKRIEQQLKETQEKLQFTEGQLKETERRLQLVERELEIANLKRLSVINGSEISNNRYILAIMRLIDSQNEEHAFLIVEGTKSIKRIDLFVDSSRPGYSMIRIGEQHIEDMNQREIKNAVSKMLGFKTKEQWRYLAWGIAQNQHDSLMADIEKDKKSPPLYGVLGNETISYSEPKHSCFTWAREKLFNLKEDEISNGLTPMLTDWLVAKTSFYLPDYPAPFWLKKEVIIPTATFITGTVLGISLKSKL